jgi:hypothetical protein
MKEEELKFISCSRKIKYHTRKKAVMALAKMKKALRLTPPELEYYKCRFCKLFHIGNGSK